MPSTEPSDGGVEDDLAASGDEEPLKVEVVAPHEPTDRPRPGPDPVSLGEARRSARTRRRSPLAQALAGEEQTP